MFKQLKFKGWMSLVVTLVLMISVAYAEEGGVNKPLGKRLDQALGQLAERGELAIEKKEQYRSRMTEVVEVFASDLMGQFESFWSSHDAVHSALLAVHQNRIEAMKVTVRERMDSIKEAVKAGEMTREEAKAELEAMRNQFSEDRDAVRAEIEALKQELDVTPEKVKALHEALRLAVAGEDTDAVHSALLEILEAQEQHLAFDQAKLAYLESQE